MGHTHTSGCYGICYLADTALLYQIPSEDLTPAISLSLNESRTVTRRVTSHFHVRGERVEGNIEEMATDVCVESTNWLASLLDTLYSCRKEV